MTQPQPQPHTPFRPKTYERFTWGCGHTTNVPLRVPHPPTFRTALCPDCYFHAHPPPPRRGRYAHRITGTYYCGHPFRIHVPRGDEERRLAWFVAVNSLCPACIFEWETAEAIRQRGLPDDSPAYQPDDRTAFTLHLTKSAIWRLETLAARHRQKPSDFLMDLLRSLLPGPAAEDSK